MKVTVLVGCNYPPNDTRAEPGDLIEVDDKIGAALIAAHAGKLTEATKAKKPTTNTPKSSLQAETGTED